MSEIQIINSMNQSIINKITEFKNNQIKKNDLNNFMVLNLCHILKTTNKIKAKNKVIQEKQDIEIKKSLSKIKSYVGDIDYSPKELEANPIMKNLINPTLESYIPLSELSYSTEINLYDKNSDKCKFNESLLFKKNSKSESDDDENEINFQEPPILYIKNTNNIKKILNKTNETNKKDELNSILKNENGNDIIELINKDDEELFKDNENNYNSFLFYELITSFDEDNKEEIRNIKDDDIEQEFKEIEPCFYFSSSSLNQRTSKRNSEKLRSVSINSGSTSFGSNNTSKGDFKINMTKELYYNEFNTHMSFDLFNKACEQMSIDYLRYLLVIYFNIFNISNKCFYCKKTMFCNLFKKFLLKIGISSKKIYDKINSDLMNNKEEICSFESFVKFLFIILKLKDEYSVLKHKFIISLFRYGEEDINIKHINIFMQLIKGKLVYNNNIYEELNRNLLQTYDSMYSTEIGTTFKFSNILTCLEILFDKKNNN